MKPPMVCAACFQKTKIVTNDTEKKKKGPVYKLAWGSLFAKGLKKQWERNGAIITTVRNIVVNSLHARAAFNRSFSAH